MARETMIIDWRWDNLNWIVRRQNAYLLVLKGDQAPTYMLMQMIATWNKSAGLYLRLISIILNCVACIYYYYIAALHVTSSFYNYTSTNVIQNDYQRS